jgi:hypothetical protein
VFLDAALQLLLGRLGAPFLVASLVDAFLVHPSGMGLTLAFAGGGFWIHAVLVQTDS